MIFYVFIGLVLLLTLASAFFIALAKVVPILAYLAYSSAVDSTFEAVDGQPYNVTQLKTGVENYGSPDEKVYLEVYYNDLGVEKVLSNNGSDAISVSILPRDGRKTFITHEGSTNVEDPRLRKYINPKDKYVLYLALEDISLQPYKVITKNGEFYQTTCTYYPLW